MPTIKKIFKGVSFLFPKQIIKLKEVMDKIKLPYTLEGEDEYAIEQVLIITMPEHNSTQQDAFDVGMLVMQTILLNK